MKQNQRNVLFKARRCLKASYQQLSEIITDEFWIENPGGWEGGPPVNESPMRKRWSIALCCMAAALEQVNLSLGMPRDS